MYLSLHGFAQTLHVFKRDVSGKSSFSSPFIVVGVEGNPIDIGAGGGAAMA